MKHKFKVGDIVTALDSDGNDSLSCYVVGASYLVIRLGKDYYHPRIDTISLTNGAQNGWAEDKFKYATNINDLSALEIECFNIDKDLLSRYSK